MTLFSPFLWLDQTQVRLSVLLNQILCFSCAWKNSQSFDHEALGICSSLRFVKDCVLTPAEPENRGCEPHSAPPAADGCQISDTATAALMDTASGHRSTGYDITVGGCDITETEPRLQTLRPSCRDDVMPWRSDSSAALNALIPPRRHGGGSPSDDITLDSSGEGDSTGSRRNIQEINFESSSWCAELTPLNISWRTSEQTEVKRSCCQTASRRATAHGTPYHWGETKPFLSAWLPNPVPTHIMYVHRVYAKMYVCI